ncbi:dTDP-6-deoxy-L-hexose 3-O-methyltransferase [Glaciecola sp. 4H-3-7+YE-5]|uniref:dTDP-6-deoxy-L-hexose 3-O-methyltransferase n=1 Tax=Paraglaciecola agarilytica NO2 TaxID=1125747 RepID=A0ABQ0I8T5_9ALTE|nr:TylF/MycF/NovP-related O-methyltransferase [Paraglaciecola agarilytica]AEE22234.1 dTDP-6-deoxy-L-hexose 3-O-methyltransferase [Glaciecola sp. 4H-3-7+YE-5]GAC05474.1 dTDP-6-deoxy-L-hexose 3-O-methyltransferase [Paraglaciecola agarilytica NO2]
MNKNRLTYDENLQWDYENGFYLTSHITRIPKMLAHYELYKSILNLPGQVVECGVFKGASFTRLCTFRDVLESSFSRKIIGFDMFGKFPMPEHDDDKHFVEKFEQSAGDGICAGELSQYLDNKGIVNFELVKGDILTTLRDYLLQHPELKIALLHIDVDVYQPTVHILEHLYERIVPGGIIMLDDYATVAGETKAVDEFLANSSLKIEKLPISHIPCFVRKPL